MKLSEIRERLADGETVIVTYGDPMASEPVIMASLSGGGSVTFGQFRWLIEDLEPVDPGLFPEGPALTYRLALCQKPGGVQDGAAEGAEPRGADIRSRGAE